MGRPRKHIDVVNVLRLRLAGRSWPQIARQLGLGQTTAYRAYRIINGRAQAFPKPQGGQTVGDHQ
jgi:hypothetical protein